MEELRSMCLWRRLLVSLHHPHLSNLYCLPLPNLHISQQVFDIQFKLLNLLLYNYSRFLYLYQENHSVKIFPLFYNNDYLCSGWCVQYLWVQYNICDQHFKLLTFFSYGFKCTRIFNQYCWSQSNPGNTNNSVIITM